MLRSQMPNLLKHGKVSSLHLFYEMSDAIIGVASKHARVFQFSLVPTTGVTFILLRSA